MNFSPAMHARKETRRRSRTLRSSLQQQSAGPFFVQKNGVITFRPSLVRSFLVLGATAFLGIHAYLLRQLTNVTATESYVSSPLGSNSTTTTHRTLTPLQARDREQYTIRINTWQRLDQLLVSVDHHASCPGVAQIQVVWCEPIDPPASLLELHPDKVVVERHSVNSLNERFHVLPTNPAPTLGILSIDDDVLRPCRAIDSGFFQWTQSPERMVGFDFRTHVVNKDGSWKYGYLSTTKEANRYSMSLPRYAFIHRDYLDWYMRDLPRPIFDHVAESFNCEDIAMSFFISSLTDGQPPLLAHFWAIETMVKLYSPKKISGTKQHKTLRDDCVESFAQQLDLKGRLKAKPILHRNGTMFECGDRGKPNDNKDHLPSNLRSNDTPRRQQEHFRTVDEWRELSGKEVMGKIAELKKEASSRAKAAGLIEHTEEWNIKYHKEE